MTSPPVGGENAPNSPGRPAPRAPAVLHQLVKVITIEVPKQRRRSMDARARMLKRTKK